MSRNLVVVVIVVLVLLAAGWFLMRPNQQTTAPTTQPAQAPAATAAIMEGTDAAVMVEAREVKVSGSEFAFSPNSLTFKKGEKIRLVFQNTGKMPHDLKIDELGVATKVVPPGQTETIEFTVEKVGSFEMYCSVGNHRAQGMKGTVTVQ